MATFAETFHGHLEKLESANQLSKTGTGRFDPLIADLATHMGISEAEIYVIACARPNNLNIRLTQGRAQHQHHRIALGVMTKEHTPKTVTSGMSAAKAFIGPGNARYDAVGVVTKQNGKWIIAGMVEGQSTDLGKALAVPFPTMKVEKVADAPPAVPIPSPPPTATASPAVPSPAPELASLVDAFSADLASAALIFPKDFVARFCAALLARPFVILAGLSGSGKTKLAEAFARWLSPPAMQDSCHRIVAVGADWMNNEPILGYPDALNAERYESRGVLDFLILASAQDRGSQPHLLIMDEMNLSHVEKYFSDFLSAMETGQAISLYEGEARGNIPKNIPLPGNLFITGTVNVDETTYMFSPKVLDRANVIEFRADEDQVFSFLDSFAQPDMSKLFGKGAAFGPRIMEARQNLHLDDEARQAVGDEFRRVFRVLASFGREFAFRTLSDVSRFVAVYQMLVPGSSVLEAIDAQIYQRVLPRLHGSRAHIQPVIWALASIALHELDDSSFEVQIMKPLAKGTTLANPFDATANGELIAAAFEGARFPLSCEKLHRMDRRAREAGFVSFMEA